MQMRSDAMTTNRKKDKTRVKQKSLLKTGDEIKFRDSITEMLFVIGSTVAYSVAKLYWIIK